MSPRILMSLAVAAVSGVLLAGCSGAESETLPSPTESISITTDDLPGLVLDAGEVTVDGTVLAFDAEDSGPKPRSYYIENGFEGEWWAEMLEQYNFQSAYYQDFGTGEEDSPVFNGSVLLELYGAPEDAAGAMVAKFDRVKMWEGQTISETTLMSVEYFAVDEPGARGIKMRMRHTSGVEYTMTNIDFVYGPVVVDIGTASTDERDLVPATLELLRLARERLDEVLLTGS